MFDTIRYREPAPESLPARYVNALLARDKAVANEDWREACVQIVRLRELTREWVSHRQQTLELIKEGV